MKNILTCLFFLLYGVSVVQAQNPGELDLSFYNQNQNFGEGISPLGEFNKVNSIVVQEDGKILVGGEFPEYNGVSRNNIVRVNPDGSLDLTFDPGAGTGFPNGDDAVSISKIALQSDGKILIGGFFDNYNGVERNGIARINQDGSLDTSFNPRNGPRFYVTGLVVQSDGKILIGGDFTDIDGIERNGIARLNQDGSLDTSFDPGLGVDERISDIVLQPDGKILIGGSFTSYNGVPMNGIARLNADGSMDTGFDIGTGFFRERLTAYANSISLQADGKILVAGSFTHYNEVTRNSIARLNDNGSLDTSFKPDARINGTYGGSTFLQSITLQSDGKILIGGDLTTNNELSGNGIARLNEDGSLDADFNPGTGILLTEPPPIYQLFDITLQADGKILIGGLFPSYNGFSANQFTRLNDDGSFDTGFNTFSGLEGNVDNLILQPDGKILVPSSYVSSLEIIREGITRLNNDGSLDIGFNLGTGADISEIAVQEDGKILVGGPFTSINGFARNSIARLNNDGSIDQGFDPETGFSRTDGNPAFIDNIILQSDGKILVSGNFTHYDGEERNGIARLNTDGSLDTNFDPGTGIFRFDSVMDFVMGRLNSIAIQQDGKILIAGDFENYNGVDIKGIARLNADGSLDTSFESGLGANPNERVHNIALQQDGKILIGGDLTSIDGVARNEIARLNSDGSLDTSFDPGLGADNRVVNIALQPDGKILIGGIFRSFNGVVRNRIARLNSDGSLDIGFDSRVGANNRIQSIAIQKDGNIIIGGNFTSYNNIPRLRIARIFGGDETSDTSPPIPDLAELPDVLAECTIDLDELEIPTATDKTDGSIQGTTDESLFPLTEEGTYTIIWTYTDLVGNSSSQTQKIIVGGTDSEIPIISAVSDIRLPTDMGACSAVCNIPIPEVKDNCCYPIASGTRSDGLELNDPYPVGETAITWTAKDMAGNEAVPVLQKVIVEDNEAPQIIGPANITVKLISQCETPDINLGSPVTSDNCSVAEVFNDAPEIFPHGETLVTWTVMDGGGNMASAEQLINITNDPPQIIEIQGPKTSLPVRAPVKLKAKFSDDNIAFATWKALNGETVVSEQKIPASGNETRHAFTNLPAGKYSIVLVLEDLCGNSTKGDYQNVVIFDPKGKNLPDDVWSNPPNGIYIADSLRNENADGKFEITNDLSKLAIPNTFTPNNDGANDTWGIEVPVGLKGIKITIIDRKGQEVFTTQDPKIKWDGTHLGRALPVGTYFYSIESMESGKIRSGIINLLNQ